MSESGALIAFEDAMRAFVVAVTILSMIFFMIEYYRKRVSWEVLWVAFIEAMNYTLAMLLPKNYLPNYGPYGMPMTRYMSWMLTCPVLIKVMLHTVSPNPDLERHNKAVIADIFMNACGFFACLYTDKVAVMALFTLGCFPAVFIVKGVLDEWNANQGKLDQPGFRKFLMALMLTSWTLFPLLFLLGPEGFGAISLRSSIMGHALGDLFAKNFYGYIAYKIKIRSDKIAEKKAAAEAKATKEKETLGLTSRQNSDPPSQIRMSVSRNSQMGPGGMGPGGMGGSQMGPGGMGMGGMGMGGMGMGMGMQMDNLDVSARSSRNAGYGNMSQFTPRTKARLLGDFQAQASSDPASQQLMQRMQEESRKIEELKAQMARMMYDQQKV